jgi:hypothetical protein
LGGKDWFAADKESGDLVAEYFPTIRTAAREGRAWLGRAVNYMVEQGIRQFLDIGTGLPTADKHSPGGSADRARIPNCLRRQ